MWQARQWHSSLLLLSALCPSAALGQYVPSTLHAESPQHGPQVIDAMQERDPSATHTQKLAGFGAGVTVSAIVLSLDAVQGSGCTGSGPYLTFCRSFFIIGAAGGGLVGALVGRMVKTKQPPGRTIGVLVGSALGTMAALLVSTVGCEQEDRSNPEYLCGFDGMVSTGAIVGGAVVGGVLAALLGRGSEGLQVTHLGPMQGSGGYVGLGATFVWRPD